MAAVLSQEAVKALLSDDHFSVDGTLIEAWASMKSFPPKDGSGEPPAPGRNGERDFHGEKRSNETHASTTDPDARLYRKGSGQPAKLAYLGHVLMENRHALLVDAADPGDRDGGARGGAGDGGGPRGQSSDHAGSRQGLRRGRVCRRPAGAQCDAHVAQNTTNRRSAIDGRTTRHSGYAVSGRVRKRIEEAFGWTKTTGGFRKTRHRGLAGVGWMFTRHHHSLQPGPVGQAGGGRGVVTAGLCPESAPQPQKISKSIQKPVSVTDSLQLKRDFRIEARQIGLRSDFFPQPGRLVSIAAASRLPVIGCHWPRSEGDHMGLLGD
jgi:hypothetical protein